MQSVLRKQIMPNTGLTCINTDKFKTGCLSVSLLTALDKRTASLNAVLPKVLRRGTARNPDMESLAAELDELYGARIEPFVRKKGELQCVGFYADFIDDAYITDDKSILEKVAALMGEVLLMPATSGGRLKEKYVLGERDNLIDEIRTGINDKRQYSIDRLTELMCDGEKYGINKLGSLETAEKISVDSLTRQYRKLLGSSRVEFFYCGSAEFERVEQAVLDAFSAMPRTEENVNIVADVISWPESGVRYFSQELDVTQGKLAIGFRIGDAIKHRSISDVLVFNAVFGGSVTSKLFVNVREKLSLCYFASSMIDKHKGIMLVSSGIEFEKYDKALTEILAQLDAVKNGEVEKWEVESAKRAVITALKTKMDQPVHLEDFYLDSALTGIECSPEELAGLVDGVTTEDVIDTAKCVHEDSVYFLKGIGGGENEA